jgi:2-amino-4-hydroxy-6-hydroxymethyldihydropteridine diphosphokinase
MPSVYIGIGSNLGNREENCKKAVKLLIENDIKVVKLSSKIETEPWGIKEQPKFINMAAKIETDIGPVELLRLFKKIESTMGRTPGMGWGPRVIDIDILLYNDLVIKTPELEIPHPHMQDRDFVLRPLAEIAPHKIHPVLKKSIKELLDELVSQ